MSLSSIELWQRLAAEGLASPMQCRSWAGETSKLLPAAETADGLKVLQTLIDIGKVTKYQAKVLAGQSSDPLKRGPWHILSRVKQPLWQGWLEITKIDTSKGEQPPPRWARWLTPAELTALQSSAPSLPRGIQLANIQAAHLQTVEMPELIDGELQLQVHPVAGRSLAERFASTKPPTELALQIIQQTAEALAAMHEKKVVHGRVTPDRIFWDDARGVTLVRDPISVWTAGVDSTMIGVLGEQLHGLKVASFLAPEFLAPRQPPSSTSDIYALGATWWWMLVGKPPAEGKSVAATLGVAAQTTLNFRADLPELPEPLRICLEKCLAKNPSARIANAGQLCEAISLALQSIAKGKVLATKPNVEPMTRAASVPIASPNKQPSAPPPIEQGQPSFAQPIQASVKQAAESKPTQAAKSPAKPVASFSSAADQDQQKTVKKAPESKDGAQQSVIKPIAAEPISPKAPTVEHAIKQGSTKLMDACTPLSSTAQPVQVENQKADRVESPLIETQATTTQAPPVAVTIIPVDSDSLAENLVAKSSSTPNSVIPDPVAQVATATKSPARPTPKKSSTGNTTARRKVRKSKLPIYLLAGFGFMALLLGILKFSGALDSTIEKKIAKGEPFTPPVSTNEPTVITKDPLLQHFRIVDSKDAVWAPPGLSEPLALDLLPPGAQLYVVIRPSEILANKNTQALLDTLQKQFQIDNLLGEIARKTGQPLQSIASVVIAFYNAAAPEQFPSTAMRVELVQPQSLDQLKSSWKVTSEAVVGQERLHVTESDMAFFVPKDSPSDTIKEFSSGPTLILKEAAELGGAAAPLNAQLKMLHGKSSQLHQLAFFGSPRYLFTEGRGLTKQLPQRLQNLLEPVLSKDARAALLQVNFAENFYWELQLVGATDADTPRLVSKLSDQASSAATAVENWFVNQTPHPYWRALAFRFPQMIRIWREYARFGVEDGIGLANGYLPSDAASNLLVASWISTQEASTMAGQLAESTSSPANSPTAMSPEEILNRPIRISFDQEPIERALALVGEEANSGVPPASQMRFELDGGAFERGGITRNQQLSGFKIDNQPARDALTLIAKRGNPVTTVKDTRELDQRLIWIVKEDPQNAGKKMVSLTTRDAATAAGDSLPVEFAAQQ